MVQHINLEFSLKRSNLSTYKIYTKTLLCWSQFICDIFYYFLTFPIMEFDFPVWDVMDFAFMHMLLFGMKYSWNHISFFFFHCNTNLSIFFFPFLDRVDFCWFKETYQCVDLIGQLMNVCFNNYICNLDIVAYLKWTPSRHLFRNGTTFQHVFCETRNLLFIISFISYVWHYLTEIVSAFFFSQKEKISNAFEQKFEIIIFLKLFVWCIFRSIWC